MFSLVCALSSPASAENGSSLFGWFTGSTAQSDSSRTCMSAVRLCAFADRPRSWSDRDVPEVSRFSCLLLLSVRRFSDYAGSPGHSRLTQSAVLPSPQRDRVGTLKEIFAALSPRPPMPLSTPPASPHGDTGKTQGQDGVAFSFPAGLFHPLPQAGLAPRTPRIAAESPHFDSGLVFQLELKADLAQVQVVGSDDLSAQANAAVPSSSL